MDEKAEYLDVRSDSCYWADAESYEDCLKGSDPKRAGRWESLYGAHLSNVLLDHLITNARRR